MITMPIRSRSVFASIVLSAFALLASACSTLTPPRLAQPFDDNYDPIISYLSGFIAKEM